MASLKDNIGFGDYVHIEQKRYRGENEMYLYKVIGISFCNYYTPVPVDPHNEISISDESVDCIKAICCGVCEEKVETFRLEDVVKIK